MKTIRKKANHISKVDLNVHVDSLNSRNSHTDSFFFFLTILPFDYGKRFYNKYKYNAKIKIINKITYKYK